MEHTESGTVSIDSFKMKEKIKKITENSEQIESLTADEVATDIDEVQKTIDGIKEYAEEVADELAKDIDDVAGVKKKFDSLKITGAILYELLNEDEINKLLEITKDSENCKKIVAFIYDCFGEILLVGDLYEYKKWITQLEEDIKQLLEDDSQKNYRESLMKQKQDVCNQCYDQIKELFALANKLLNELKKAKNIKEKTKNNFKNLKAIEEKIEKSISLDKKNNIEVVKEDMEEGKGIMEEGKGEEDFFNEKVKEVKDVLLLAKNRKQDAEVALNDLKKIAKELNKIKEYLKNAEIDEKERNALRFLNKVGREANNTYFALYDDLEKLKSGISKLTMELQVLKSTYKKVSAAISFNDDKNDDEQVTKFYNKCEDCDKRIQKVLSKTRNALIGASYAYDRIKEIEQAIENVEQYKFTEKFNMTDVNNNLKDYIKDSYNRKKIDDNVVKETKEHVKKREGKDENIMEEGKDENTMEEKKDNKSIISDDWVIVPDKKVVPDKKGKTIKKEFYILKEKAIKTGLKYIGEPENFDIYNNGAEIYHAFEDMRKDLLALLANETNSSNEARLNPQMYLTGKDKFDRQKPNNENITYDLLKEEIKEISKILKNYKAPKKSNTSQGTVDVLVFAFGKKYANEYRSIEKEYFNIKKEANNKLLDNEYKAPDNEYFKKIVEMEFIPSDQSGKNVKDDICMLYLNYLTFDIIKLLKTISDTVNKNNESEKNKVDEYINSKDLTKAIDIDEEKIEVVDSDDLEKELDELKESLGKVKKLMKKGIQELSKKPSTDDKKGEKSSKDDKKGEKLEKRLSDAQIIVRLKKLYAVQKKLAREHDIAIGTELGNLFIDDEECIRNIFSQFKDLKKCILDGRKIKLEEERDNISTTANSIPAGDKKNRLKARLENITSALKKLDKKLNRIEKDALKLSEDGKVLYETKIDLLNYAQKTKAELMRLISDDTTELKETQEKKIESGGRGLGEKVKESVGEFFGSLFGKKVELSLDNGLVTDFKKIINSTKNSSDNIQLKSIIQNDFSDRKKIYESWYEYIYSSAEKFDKFFANKNAKMNLNSARIVLMYIFLRSLVHAKLEDVNSIRKGLKTFVKEVTKPQPTENREVEKSNNNSSDVDENIKAAGKIVLDICQILKNNIFTILNRKKNIKNVVKKSDCLKILEYVPAVGKDNDEKKFKKDLKSKFK